MSIAMTLKVFSDCCVCFAILGAFPSVFPHSFPLLLPALLCGIAAGLATFFRDTYKTLPSRLCAAIPLLSLFFAGEFREMIILFPVILYTAAIILWGELQLEYYNYRQFFLRSLILLGLLCAVLSTIYILETKIGTSLSLVHAGVTLRFTLVHLLCGVILQRQLRLGAGTRSRGEAGQLAAMLGGPGVAILGVLVLSSLLRDSAAAAFRYLVSLLFNLVSTEISPSTQEKPNPVHTETPPPPEYTAPPPPIDPVIPQIEQIVNSGPEERSLWWLIFVAAVLVVALGLMFLSFRRKGEAVRSAETVGAADLPEKENRPSRRSNRGKVRQLYREFLRLERKRGLTLKQDYTTADILHRISKDTDETAAARLRDIYIRARYDETREVSRAQVDAAKAALKSSRSTTAPKQ